MGIYIPGMKLPKEEDCIIVFFPDGERRGAKKGGVIDDP